MKNDDYSSIVVGWIGTAFICLIIGLWIGGCIEQNKMQAQAVDAGHGEWYVTNHQKEWRWKERSE